MEITRTDLAPARPGSVVGVDLGVTSLAVLSTGEVVANPRHLEIAQRELRRSQRQAARRTGPDRSTGQRPSRRWLRTQARIVTLHTAVVNARRDSLHQLTTRLARTHGTIVIENLHVAGMLRNRRLPGTSPGSAWANSAANSATRAGGARSRTAGTRRRKPVPTVAR